MSFQSLALRFSDCPRHPGCLTLASKILEVILVKNPSELRLQPIAIDSHAELLVRLFDDERRIVMAEES